MIERTHRDQRCGRSTGSSGWGPSRGCRMPSSWSGSSPVAMRRPSRQLVARHGPMVLAVCRGVLREEHAAEDAFQATFLILVRKAGAIRGRGALGGWLHRVAHRVAVQAHADARRRRKQERRAGVLRLDERAGDESRDDARAAVHEEMAGCRSGIACRWCSAIWRAGRTPRLPRSCAAARRRSAGGSPRPASGSGAAVPPRGRSPRRRTRRGAGA